ncbi:uncharacterized protein FIBRA_03290 [Fibroporia radiculosa]|uniref:Protein kinase domain-containing protein n=1 Tax=Fibroporia radiculosa TaxID=599839 RepID=J4I9I9_9APHY|nr:uncharacterized protein FIBRA_03290 [Fibroporia radiculosa]CCM01241.1 predicted protein [Fibroporia radiculosa]
MSGRKGEREILPQSVVEPTRCFTKKSGDDGIPKLAVNDDPREIYLELQGLGDFTFSNIGAFSLFPPSTPCIPASPTLVSNPSIPAYSMRMVPTSISSCDHNSSVSDADGKTETRSLNRTHFSAIKALGAGGQGVVLLVQDEFTGSQHALKVIRKARLRPVSLARIYEEQYILRHLALADDTWFTRLEGSFHDSESFFLLTEYAPRGDLFTEISRYKIFPQHRALQYSAEIIHILSVLHDTHHIVHRDIKPENFLIDNRGHLILTDFGISRLFRFGQQSRPWDSGHDIGYQGERDFAESKHSFRGHQETAHVQRDVERPLGMGLPEMTRTMCGTPGFMAPELFTGTLYSYQVDVWAAGVTIYKMVLGKLPFQIHRRLSTKEAYHRSITLPLEFQADDRPVHDEIKELLRKMLEKVPSERPPAQELKADPYFSSIDWELVKSKDRAGPGIDARERKYQGKDRLEMIPFGQAISAQEDPSPWFTWTSPSLTSWLDDRKRGGEPSPIIGLRTVKQPSGMTHRLRTWCSMRKLDVSP